MSTLRSADRSLPFIDTHAIELEARRLRAQSARALAKAVSRGTRSALRQLRLSRVNFVKTLRA